MKETNEWEDKEAGEWLRKWKKIVNEKGEERNEVKMEVKERKKYIWVRGDRGVEENNIGNGRRYLEKHGKGEIWKKGDGNKGKKERGWIDRGQVKDS